MAEKTHQPNSEQPSKSSHRSQTETFTEAVPSEIAALDTLTLMGTQNQQWRIQRALQTQRVLGNQYIARRLNHKTMPLDVSRVPEGEYLSRSCSCGGTCAHCNGHAEEQEEIDSADRVQRTLELPALDATTDFAETEYFEEAPTIGDVQTPHDLDADRYSDDDKTGDEIDPEGVTAISQDLTAEMPDGSETVEHGANQALETVSELPEEDDANIKLPETEFPGETEESDETREENTPAFDPNTIFGDLDSLLGEAASPAPAVAAPSADGGGVIQRLSLSDFNPATIISQVRGLFSSSESTEEQAEQSVDQETSQTQGGFRDQTSQFEQGMDTVNSETDQTARQADSRKEAVENQTNEANREIEQQGSQAASRVSAVQPVIAPALSPLGPFISPELMSGVAERVASVGEAADLGNLPGDIRNDVQEGLAADGDPGWDCDEAEIMAIAGNVGRTVLGRFIRVGDTLTGGRVSKAIAFAQNIGQKIRGIASTVVGGVRRVASTVSSAIKRKLQPLTNAINRGMETARNLVRTARTALGSVYNSARTRLVNGIKRVKEGVTRFVDQQITRVQNGIKTAVGTIQSIISGIGAIARRVLPDWVINAAQSLRNRISNFATRVKRGIANLAKMAEDLKNLAVAKVRGWVDRKLQRFASAYQLFLKVKERLKEGARSVARRAIELIPKPIRDLASSAAGLVRTGVNKLREAANRVAQKIKGAVCEPLEDAATPCLDQWMPFDEKTSSSVRVFSSADATIPLGEFGVKGSAELKEGAALTISRTGAKTYTVTVEGESGLALTHATEKNEVTFDIDLPSGGNARMWEIWSKLTGRGDSNGNGTSAASNGGSTPATQGSGGTTPAAGGSSTPATTNGSQPAQQGGVGGSSGRKMEGKIGSVYNVALTYTFNADTPCDLTTMAGLLAAYGAAGALSNIVPEPFSRFLTGAVAIPFSSNLTSVKFTNTAVLEGSAELPGDAVTLTAAATAATAAEVFRIPEGTEPDEEGNRPGDMGVRLSQQLTGSAAGELTVAELFKGTAGGSVSATQTLTLVFTGDAILPRSLSSQLSATLSADVFGIDLLPQAVAAAGGTVQQRLKRLMDNGIRGNITATLTQSVNKLDEVAGRLESYFASTNPSDVNSTDVLLTVRSFLAQPGVVVQRFEVKLTETHRVGAKIGASAGGEGQVLGANAAVGAEHSTVHTLYP